MDQERWQQVKALLDAAQERRPAQRAAFLDEMCGSDAALRREVETLLAAYDQAIEAELFEVPAFDQGKVSHPMKGRHIGPYRLTEEIGYGGMGEVYLAERADDQFQKQVAIKLIRHGRHSEELLRRFRHERQILAALQHPHIAQMHDGGITEDGLPYIVMAYIEGRPLDQYCDDNKLNITNRLDLFLNVCSAVQYAHQNFIVHRDLKPGNVLVTTEGQVKLLDFGIAKLLDTEAGPGDLPLTQTGMRVMTPAYAGPEQIRGEPITTATDVYGLGVLLYELLTGHRPYDVEGLSPSEVEQVICEAQPGKPSTALTRTDDRMPADLSRKRDTEPGRLRKRLAGDLDNIVLKALRKEPARRYASVAELAEDIRRHLAGLPVSARPATFGYRARKFAGRHRWRIGMVATVLALLIGFGLYHTAQITVERDAARIEQQKAQAVAQFTISLLTASNPEEAADGSITARALLDRGAERVENELQNQPAVRAKMLSVMGHTYRLWGFSQKADTLLGNALQIHHMLGEEANPDYAETLTYLAQLQIGKGNLDHAKALLNKAEIVLRQLYGDLHPSIAWNLLAQGTTQGFLGNTDEAEFLYRTAISIYRNLPGEPDPNLGEALNYLARLLREQESYTEAESLYREALATFRSRYGEKQHTDIAWTLSDLGVLLTKTGAYGEAEPLLREAVEINRHVFGDKHPEYLFTLYNLALCLLEKGAPHEAEPLLRYALAVYQSLNPNDWRIARTADLLGEALMEMQHYEEAEEALKSSFSLLLTLRGEQDAQTQQVLGHLIALYDAWGRPEQADLYRAQLTPPNIP